MGSISRVAGFYRNRRWLGPVGFVLFLTIPVPAVWVFGMAMGHDDRWHAEMGPPYSWEAMGPTDWMLYNGLSLLMWLWIGAALGMLGADVVGRVCERLDDRATLRALDQAEARTGA